MFFLTAILITYIKWGTPAQIFLEKGATFVIFSPKLSSFIDWCCYYTQVSYTGSWEPLVCKVQKVVISNYANGEVYWYNISDKVCQLFSRVFRFPPPIKKWNQIHSFNESGSLPWIRKPTARYNWNIVENGIKYHNPCPIKSNLITNMNTFLPSHQSSHSRLC